MASLPHNGHVAFTLHFPLGNDGAAIHCVHIENPHYNRLSPRCMSLCKTKEGRGPTRPWFDPLRLANCYLALRRHYSKTVRSVERNPLLGTIRVYLPFLRGTLIVSTVAVVGLCASHCHSTKRHVVTTRCVCHWAAFEGLEGPSFRAVGYNGH